MTAPAPLLALLEIFVQCFTKPGFAHFTHFILAHAALWGAPHCVTETLRVTLWHRLKHWTTPYVFMKRGRWSCRQLSGLLLGLPLRRLGLDDLVLAIDDTLVRRWDRCFFGLGLYPDPTDKNPGAGRRKVWGHCWVMVALLWEKARGRWFCFPLAAWLFVPPRALPAGWAPRTKIELAAQMLDWLAPAGRRNDLFTPGHEIGGFNGVAPAGRFTLQKEFIPAKIVFSAIVVEQYDIHA